ncbi:hypothetical protein [uncultured Sphingomonas sp.]|uniref:hypothetical protein n=1 Tax=uncultured Sphingomonas sp. TaxID=158754 RepID=UPI0026269775|nr:hypothetical protein [uncultured Sphingomonas sp.]
MFVGEYRAYERSLRAVFASGGRVAAAAAEAQASQPLSPIAGHQVFAAISHANVSITDAISKIAEGHRVLEVMAGKMGVDITAYGDKFDFA